VTRAKIPCGSAERLVQSSEQRCRGCWQSPHRLSKSAAKRARHVLRKLLPGLHDHPLTILRLVNLLRAGNFHLPWPPPPPPAAAGPGRAK
jgi:hypothetical protein